MTPLEFERDWALFQQAGHSFDCYEISPVLNEDKQQHREWSYILHTAWAARVLSYLKPLRHVDISSSTYFSTIVSAFIPVEFYEYQKADVALDGLTTGFADLKNLPFRSDSIASLSCMHTIEHLGLNRYGDGVDPSADKTAAKELTSVLKPNGDLLVVVPVGKPILRFNSARTYSYQMVIDMFPLYLVEFSLIPDQDQPELIRHADPNLVAEQPGDATGCFWFRKGE